MTKKLLMMVTKSWASRVLKCTNQKNQRRLIRNLKGSVLLTKLKKYSRYKMKSKN